MRTVAGNRNHEVADFMRRLKEHGFDFDGRNVAAAIECDPTDDAACWDRLAELIDRPLVRGGADA